MLACSDSLSTDPSPNSFAPFDGLGQKLHTRFRHHSAQALQRGGTRTGQPILQPLEGLGGQSGLLRQLLTGPTKKSSRSAHLSDRGQHFARRAEEKHVVYGPDGLLPQIGGMRKQTSYKRRLHLDAAIYAAQPSRSTGASDRIGAPARQDSRKHHYRCIPAFDAHPITGREWWRWISICLRLGGPGPR